LRLVLFFIKYRAGGNYPLYEGEILFSRRTFYMKKFCFIGMAAILGAALSFFGCENTYDRAIGATGVSVVPGAATLPMDAEPELLKAYYETGINKVFMIARPAAKTFNVPTGKTLAVVGDVALASGTVINAFDGTLDVSNGSFAGGNGTFIVSDAQVAVIKNNVPVGSIPKYEANPDFTKSISEKVVLQNLVLGGKDLPTGVQLAAYAGTSEIFVLGTATAEGTFNTGSTKLDVLGEMKANGTLTLGSATKVAKLTATGALNLTGVSGVSELDTGAFQITSTNAAIALDSLDGAGKLVLTGPVTRVQIGGGNGNVDLTNIIIAFTSNTDADASFFKNTGKTSFPNASSAISVKKTNGTGGVAFHGSVDFAASLTLTAVPATFYAPVSFADNTALMLTSTASIVKLKPGAALTVKGNDTSNILVNDDTNNVTLTPIGTNVSLRFIDASKTIEQDATNRDCGITIDGIATLAAGTTYKVNSGKNKPCILTVSGILNLASTTTSKASLVMTCEDNSGAKLTGAGKVVAGATEIVGGTNGWQAGTAGKTGTVTISENSIAASIRDLTLRGANGAKINVTAAMLTVTAQINVTAAGTVTLTGNGSTAGSLLLKGGAIPGLLIPGTSMIPVKLGDALTTTNFELMDSKDNVGTKVLVTKDGTAPAAAVNILATGNNATGGITLGTIGGGSTADTDDAVLTGQIAAVDASIIAKNWKVWVPNT
jgi:hypothetical protein